MKHTLKKLYTYFSIILLTAFCTFSFAQDAFSAPKWIKVTYSKPTLQVIGKDKNNSGYLALKVSVTHKNNSKKGEVIKRMSGIHIAIPVFSKGYRPKQGKVAP